VRAAGALGGALPFACALAACTERDHRSADAGSPEAGKPVHHGGAGGRPSYLPDLAAIRCEPTLASLQQDVFKVTCAFDSCHGSNNAAWGLTLMEPDVFELLVGRKAGVCDGWLRVVPGSPEQSLLYHKVADEKPPCGDRMPSGLGALPASVQACFSGWIESLGADASSDASTDASRPGALPDASSDAVAPRGRVDAASDAVAPRGRVDAASDAVAPRGRVDASADASGPRDR
jgi:hypothetical protein